MDASAPRVVLGDIAIDAAFAAGLGVVAGSIFDLSGSR